MSPWYIGVGSPNRWTGLGVCMDGGDGKDLVRTVACLAERLGGIGAFWRFAQCEPGGWKSLVGRKRLHESSGVFPFRVERDVHDRYRVHARHERGLFLISDNQVDVYQGGPRTARIVENAGGLTIEWASGGQERPTSTKDVSDYEARWGRFTELKPVNPTEVEAHRDRGFARAIRRCDNVSASLVRLALRKAVARATCGVSGPAFLISDHSDHKFERLNFDGSPVLMASNPQLGWRDLRVVSLESDMCWSKAQDHVAIEAQGGLRDAPWFWRGLELDREDVVAINQEVAALCDDAYPAPIPASRQNGMGQYCAQLLRWASD